jgi:formate-dependent nitrite reductase membrane component NrfD
MLMERVNLLHWDWIVALEMLIAGVAAGAYMVAALLEWLGRGRSPLARAAHAVVFPLVAVAALLLTLDLARPERFWHMIVQSKTMLPMLKPWSPISLGSTLLFLFGGVTFVSFVDALIGAGLFRIGPWSPNRTLHGSALGKAWTLLGLTLAFGMASYSGILLTVTSIPGWAGSAMIGPVFFATAAVTGAAALVLIQTLRGQTDADVRALERASAWLIGWWLLLVVVFIATLGEGLRFILAGPALAAMIGAVVLGGVIPLALRFAPGSRSATLMPLSAALILIGGGLLRYAIVQGPQSFH